jgi:hypothetical protein
MHGKLSTQHMQHTLLVKLFAHFMVDSNVACVVWEAKL